MYQTDQPTIARFAQQSPENTARVIEFVLVSIRRRFDLVKPMMTGVCDINTTDLTKRGIQYARDNAVELHQAIFSPQLSTVDKLMRVLEVPGLGLAKAGFVMQLTLGTVGCLDTHNLARFSLKASAFATSGKPLHIIRKRAESYVQTCERLGGSEFLWNTWCELIAKKYSKIFRDADHVSREHVDATVR